MVVVDSLQQNRKMQIAALPAIVTCPPSFSSRSHSSYHRFSFHCGSILYMQSFGSKDSLLWWPLSSNLISKGT